MRHIPKNIPLWLAGMLIGIGFALITLLLYGNVIPGEFVFDDIHGILLSPVIREANNSGAIWQYSHARFIPNLTFASSYALDGFHPEIYHLTNILLHAGNAFLVWMLALLLTHKKRLALLAGLLFLIHPIQTQAVSYAIQRMTLLAASFYLLSLLCYLKLRKTKRLLSMFLWGIGMFVSLMAAYVSKENTYTFIFVILSVELIFSFMRKRSRSAVAAVIALIALFMLGMYSITRMGEAVAFPQSIKALTQLPDARLPGTSLSRTQYILTQLHVTYTYGRLLVLPIGQNADYDYPVTIAFGLQEIAAGTGVLLLLFFAYRQRRSMPLVSFGIFFFFAALIVESTIIPIEDVIAEHRLYLPSVGFFLAAAFFIEKFIIRTLHPRSAIIILSALLLTLSLLTYKRTAVWLDNVSFWNDVVTKSPQKMRAYFNLGIIYYNQKNYDKAALMFETAIQKKPEFIPNYNNAGSAYEKLGKTSAAKEMYSRALVLNPDDIVARNNLAMLYFRSGNREAAAKELNIARKIDPDFALTQKNLRTIK